MKTPLHLLVLVCAVLVCAAPRLLASPVDLPDATPDPTPERKVRRAVRPTEEVARKAQPVPSPTPNAEPAAGGAGTTQAAASNPPPSPAGAAEAMGTVRRTVYKPDPASETVYTLSATQPFDSKSTGQKIRLTIAASSTRDVTLENKKVVQQPFTSTLTTSINTGRTKSLSQLRDLLRDVFQRFGSGAVTPNQDLGKLGDARYGGELHFVVEDMDTLRFDYVPKTQDVIRFKRIDIQKFAELLAQ